MTEAQRRVLCLLHSRIGGEAHEDTIAARLFDGRRNIARRVLNRLRREKLIHAAPANRADTWVMADAGRRALAEEPRS